MSAKTEQAAAFFDSGFNCAQSVLATFCEAYGVEQETALKMSSGMGGGFRSGEICGAVSGAVQVIGLKYGQHIAGDKAAKEECNRRVVAFVRVFREKNSSVVCREILDYDVSKQDEYAQAQSKNLFKTTCAEMIKSAVALLEALDY